MQAWIDQDACMGAGTCEQVAPEILVAKDDAVRVVGEAAAHFGTSRVFAGEDGPDGPAGRARVPEYLTSVAIEAAEECPGEYIHAEV